MKEGRSEGGKEGIKQINNISPHLPNSPSPHLPISPSPQLPISLSPHLPTLPYLFQVRYNYCPPVAIAIFN
ncbi:MAG: hypothetical protein QNJ51_29560 [Calothrix sp. MO_167.B12]|nr:hypothetical protein [Calothrix sp. MO_167.B12]